MDDLEHVRKSSSSTSDAVLQLIQTLNAAVVYSEPTNFQTNVKLWNQYAKDWGKDVDWVIRMVDNLQIGQSAEEYLEYVGDEWSTKEDLQCVLNDFFYPYLTPDSVVAELGSGGGRVTCKIAPRVKQMHCFDISEEMIKLARAAVSQKEFTNVHFEMLTAPKFPDKYAQQFDFVFAFDVFPHVDLHTQWKYYLEFKRILKPGGRAVIHTANLEAPQGWARFVKQEKYTVGGFYFMTPAAVNKLIKEAGLQIIKYSTPTDTCMYYNRDYIVLVEN